MQINHYYLLIDFLINKYNQNEIEPKFEVQQLEMPKLENEIEKQTNYFSNNTNNIQNEKSILLSNINTVEFIGVNEFFGLLLNDFNNLTLSNQFKFTIISEYIKYIFELDANDSIATNPRIDDITFENLSQIANLVIYAIYKELIDPIEGSILIAELWPLLSYDSRLNQFIGREMEVNDIQNQIKETTDAIEIDKLQKKIETEKRKLIFECQLFITNLTR